MKCYLIELWEVFCVFSLRFCLLIPQLQVMAVFRCVQFLHCEMYEKTCQVFQSHLGSRCKCFFFTLPLFFGKYKVHITCSCQHDGYNLYSHVVSENPEEIRLFHSRKITNKNVLGF